jgi:hypothetical protein
MKRFFEMLLCSKTCDLVIPKEMNFFKYFLEPLEKNALIKVGAGLPPQLSTIAASQAKPPK